MKKLKIHFFKILSVVLLFALFVVGGLYLKTLKEKAAIEKAEDITVSQVSKLMLLPEEKPQITTVENVEKAKERDFNFFKNVKVGDKLLAYQNLVVLFDPKANKILNVQTPSAPTPAPPAQPLRISFRYNGNEEERARTLKAQIEAISPNIQVTEVSKSKVNYKTDVIFLVNKNKKEDALRFAQILGGSPLIPDLDPNEASTEADVVVAFREIKLATPSPSPKISPP